METRDRSGLRAALLNPRRRCRSSRWCVQLRSDETMDRVTSRTRVRKNGQREGPAGFVVTRPLPYLTTHSPVEQAWRQGGIDIAMKAAVDSDGTVRAVDLVDSNVARNPRRAVREFAEPNFSRDRSFDAWSRPVNWAENRDPASTTTSLERSKRERWPNVPSRG